MLGQFLAQERDRRMQINGRRVLKLADLLPDFLNDLRMAMADRNANDAGETVQVLLAGLIPEILHMAFNDEQRLLVVGDQAGCQILAAQGKDFRTRGTRVRSGVVRQKAARKLCGSMFWPAVLPPQLQGPLRSLP